MTDIITTLQGVDKIPDATIHTASSTSCFMRCAKLYHYKYELGYRQAATIPAYLIGTAVHIGLESFWKGEPFTAAMASIVKFVKTESYFTTDAGKLEQARVYAYIKGYYSKWASDLDLYEVLGVEVEFKRVKRDTQNSRLVFGDVLKGQVVAGKLDALVRRKSDGQLIIIEHKTAGAYSKADDFGSTYWSKLSMDNQACIYVDNIEKLTGEKPLIMYDIVLKTRSTPLKSKKRKKKDETDSEFQLRYQADSESMQGYQTRLANKYVAECDSRYFRQIVYFAGGELEEKIEEIESVSQAIDSNVGGTRIRNTVACNSFGSTCEFMGVCTGLEQLDDPKFIKKETAHEELQQEKETQV